MSPLGLEASPGQLGSVGEPRLAQPSPAKPRIALASPGDPSQTSQASLPPASVKIETKRKKVIWEALGVIWASFLFQYSPGDGGGLASPGHASPGQPRPGQPRPAQPRQASASLSLRLLKIMMDFLMLQYVPQCFV